MIILNLPREERYKTENVILCGIIPGPSEPKLTVNSFLAPLIYDLQLFMNGVEYSLPGNVHVNIKAALLLTSSDIPATRKLCGFIGHSANACSKCLLPFKCGTFPINYNNSLQRNNCDHRIHADLH